MSEQDIRTIYPNGIAGVGFAYATRQEADRMAQPGRIACVSVLYREGDGLEVRAA